MWEERHTFQNEKVRWKTETKMDERCLKISEENGCLWLEKKG